MNKNQDKQFITGYQAIIKAALAAGAEMMVGYPITPTTEILEGWSEEAIKSDKIKFLQAEDETAAGFMMIGGVLAGKKTFTATGGIGHVLMQDGLSMAEQMRLPVVVVAMQRGGPSTGTVIYSQQEVNLACFGGNGEGFRIVYSTANPQDLYDYTIKAFNVAWKYNFPTIVLGDGYQTKMITEVELYDPNTRKINTTESKPFVLNPKTHPKRYISLINTFNLEEELNEKINDIQAAYDNATSQIIESESFYTEDADITIFAHGSVASAALSAVKAMKDEGSNVGLFRPITLRPFPIAEARAAASIPKKIIIAESAQGQFARILKEALYGIGTPVEEYFMPALGFTPEEITKFTIKKLSRIK